MGLVAALRSGMEDAQRRRRRRRSVPTWMLALALLQGVPGGYAASNQSPLVGSNWGSPRRYVHLQTSTELSNFYLEIKLDGTVRGSASRNPYSTRHVSVFSPSAFCRPCRC